MACLAYLPNLSQLLGGLSEDRDSSPHSLPSLLRPLLDPPPPGFSTPHQALESCVGLTQTSEVEAGLEEEVRRAGGAPFATKEKQTSCLELPKWELGLRTLLVTTAATS